MSYKRGSCVARRRARPKVSPGGRAALRRRRRRFSGVACHRHELSRRRAVGHELIKMALAAPVTVPRFSRGVGARPLLWLVCSFNRFLYLLLLIILSSVPPVVCEVGEVLAQRDSLPSFFVRLLDRIGEVLA